MNIKELHHDSIPQISAKAPQAQHTPAKARQCGEGPRDPGKPRSNQACAADRPSAERSRCHDRRTRPGARLATPQRARCDVRGSAKKAQTLDQKAGNRRICGSLPDRRISGRNARGAKGRAHHNRSGTNVADPDAMDPIHARRSPRPLDDLQAHDGLGASGSSLRRALGGNPAPDPRPHPGFRARSRLPATGRRTTKARYGVPPVLERTQSPGPRNDGGLPVREQDLHQPRKITGTQWSGPEFFGTRPRIGRSTK